ncbi:hypothetical protein [Paraclostridium bifermentans]|uniref:hypothetical protein n=1 Tax=Paraclostridium bifermentans TaxID=1490 RepID=UPI00374E5761
MSKENLKRLKDTMGSEAIDLLPRQITSIVDFTSFQEELDNILGIVENFSNNLWSEENEDLGSFLNLLLSVREGKISGDNLDNNIKSMTHLSQDMFTLHDALRDSNIFSNYAQRLYFVGTRLSLFKDVLVTIQGGYPLKEKGNCPDRVLLLDYKEVNSKTIDYLKYKLTRGFFIANKLALRKKLKSLRHVNVDMNKESLSLTSLYERVMSTNIVFEEALISKDLYEEIENNYRKFYLSHLLDYYKTLFAWLNPQQVLKTILTGTKADIKNLHTKLIGAYEISDLSLKKLFKQEISFNKIPFKAIDKNSADPLYKELCTLFRYTQHIKFLLLLSGVVVHESYPNYKKSVQG